MFRVMPFCLIIAFLTVGCGEQLSIDDDGEFTESSATDTNKASDFRIVAPALCPHPCTISVTGLPNQLQQGVRYIVNGIDMGINPNWWLGYAHVLPVSTTGQLTIEAEVLDLAGFTIDSAIDTIMIPSTNGYEDTGSTRTQFANDSVQIDTGNTCSNPCELKASISGAIDKVQFFAGPYYLGEAGSNSDFSISYEFSQVGPRDIKAVGMTWGGAIKAEQSKRITVESSQPSFNNSGPSSNSDGRYNSTVGNRMADAAYSIATRRNTVGDCYNATADAIETVTGPFLWGASAYMAADQLRASAWFFEVPVGNLRALPAGAVVVWGKGTSEHGHISIALGNGQEASDHVTSQMTYHYGGAPARVFYPQ